ncbi:MAG TPA: zinc-dependent alcohol dehydrogenase family protein [Alphaproteobacteria bacterium]|nr:zinc-dependent alcohol dehydrogenase family protein [Alphaproteobacteria bacterium]
MKIKAAVLRQMGKSFPYATSKPLAIEEIDLDPPGEGEVLVRIAAAGLCHSDLSVMAGVRVWPLPLVVGHEASAVVEEVGAGVKDLKPGDHVVMVFRPSCGHCEPCATGRPALCEPGFATSVAGTLLSGARRLHKGAEEINHQVGVSCFAQYAVASRRSLVKIDRSLPLDVAALFGCAVITGAGAVFNAAQVPVGATVAVVGLGGVGLSAMLAAIHLGARRVVAIDPLARKRELARQLGATDAFDASDPKVVENVKDATQGGVEYAIEAAGSVDALDIAYRATKRGGTTVTVGLSHPNDKYAIQHTSLIAEERTLKGSYLGSCVPLRDVPRYIALHQAGRLPVDRLVNEHVKLEEINMAFDRLAAGATVRQILVP